MLILNKQKIYKSDMHITMKLQKQKQQGHFLFNPIAFIIDKMQKNI
jgi:hypothetical protein